MYEYSNKVKSLKWNMKIHLVKGYIIPQNIWNNIWIVSYYICFCFNRCHHFFFHYLKFISSFSSSIDQIKNFETFKSWNIKRFNFIFFQFFFQYIITTLEIHFLFFDTQWSITWHFHSNESVLTNDNNKLFIEQAEGQDLALKFSPLVFKWRVNFQSNQSDW